MDVSIFGLGYVGMVSAACLAKSGHKVIGVDPNLIKVDLVNNFHAPIIEKGLEDMVGNAVQNGLLRATNDPFKALNNSTLSLVCVGTPSKNNGDLDLTYVQRVCKDIGQSLADKNEFHVVVVRSTILPGSMYNLVIPILEKYSGKKAGQDFGIGINPEFLREGSAVYDYFNPPKTIIGTDDQITSNMIGSLYKDINAPLIRTDIKVAEMIKYADNAWHAVKIAFANEIGAICKSQKIDSHVVMDIFCQDLKLNISSSYLKPGFAFGGSCLPKDLRALQYKAKTEDLDLPLLNNVLRSNRRQVDRSLQLIHEQGKKRIGILGFSFKAGTDDLRESPVVEVIERLIGKGFDLRLYDRNVNLATLMGANRDYILNKIPHISKLMMTTMQGVLDHAELVIIGNNDPEFRVLLNGCSSSQVKIIDLVRLDKDISKIENYEGIGW